MTKWGWMRQRPVGNGVRFLPGTLEETYDRVSRDGGLWVLVSSNPLSEYQRVMTEVQAAREAAPGCPPEGSRIPADGRTDPDPY